MEQLWDRICEHTGKTDLKKIEAKAYSEIANWKFNDGNGSNKGSNYFVIPTCKWVENNEIEDRRKRYLHFMNHAFQWDTQFNSLTATDDDASRLLLSFSESGITHGSNEPSVHGPFEAPNSVYHAWEKRRMARNVSIDSSTDEAGENSDADDDLNGCEEAEVMAANSQFHLRNKLENHKLTEFSQSVRIALLPADKSELKQWQIKKEQPILEPGKPR